MTAIASAFPGALRTVQPPNVKRNAGVDVKREDPVLLSAVYNLAAMHPHDVLTITSGARDRAPQSSGYPVAPSGRSFHNPAATGTGLAEAIDAVVNGQPVANVYGSNELALVGLHAPVPNDPVHLTLMGWNG